MSITFDPAKRARTIAERGLDFSDAEEVFAARNLTVEDDRFDYGEVRYSTVGLLRGRMVIVIWTPRADARHIISMRKANDREKARFRKQLEQG
jgi:uncharacterized DUF497 family protein